MTEEPPERTRKMRDVNAMICALVEQETLEYPFWIGGIVTRCYISEWGHVYFELQDGEHSIQCFVREEIRGTLTTNLVNGLDVNVFGSVRVYEKHARVQIEVEKVQPALGTIAPDSHSVFDQLQAQGLWPKEKKAIPQNIRRIGLVTSKHSEAIHDFEDAYRREGGLAVTQLIDVRLQSPKDIAQAVHRFNQEKQVDVIVIIQGGGRTTDLNVFDDVLIGAAICTSDIPVITGIGHQRNDTIADQVADLSTITPTAAATHLARLSPILHTITVTKNTPWRLYALASMAFALCLIALIVFLLVR